MSLVESTDTAMVVGIPLVTSLILYVAVGPLKPENREDTDALVDSLDNAPDSERAAANT